MAVAFTVHASSRSECADALDRLCQRLGLAPSLPPVRQPGTERWMARATAAQHEAPPDNADGASVRWPHRPSR